MIHRSKGCLVVWYDEIAEMWCAMRRGEPAVYCCRDKGRAQDYYFGWIYGGGRD